MYFNEFVVAFSIGLVMSIPGRVWDKCLAYISQHHLVKFLICLLNRDNNFSLPYIKNTLMGATITLPNRQSTTTALGTSNMS